MSIFKWIGGVIGWASGGIIGGLIGFAIGTAIDSRATRAGRTTTTEADFKMSLLVLIAALMKADGSVKKSELDFVKQLFRSNFGEQATLEALQVLKGLLEKDIDVDGVASQIGRNMSYSGRLELLHLLFKLSVSDTSLHEAEKSLLARISIRMGISNADYNSLRSMYEDGSYYQGNRNRGNASGYWDINTAYKILEIEPTATDEDVKKAFRKMAMKYHPDKLNGLGEDIKKQGEEKFKKVKEAYEVIKNHRNMK